MISALVPVAGSFYLFLFLLTARANGPFAIFLTLLGLWYVKGVIQAFWRWRQQGGSRGGVCVV